MLDYQIIFLVLLGGWILGILTVGAVEKVITYRKNKQYEYIRNRKLHDKLVFYSLQNQLKEK